MWAIAMWVLKKGQVNWNKEDKIQIRGGKKRKLKSNTSWFESDHCNWSFNS